jgi:hypothetical protein
MPADIGMTRIQFGSIAGEIVGGDATLGRGTEPGVFRIRVADLDPIVETAPGTLTLTEDGTTLTFPNCTASPSTMRLHNCNKDYSEWVVNVFDERYQMKRKMVCGEYNRRAPDNQVIDDGSKKTAEELLDLLMSQVGVTADTSSVMSGVYPSVKWDGMKWQDAVDELCAKLCVHLAPTAAGGWKFYTSGKGNELPSNSTATNINPDSPAMIDSGPATIIVECGPTLFGWALELEAVGLDKDGQYKLLDDLSYNPANNGLPGWGSNWPSLFSYVEPGARHLAFQTVYRCYRVKVPQSTPFGTINSIDDIDLNDYRVIPDSEDHPPPLVFWEYWGWSDHPYNVGQCPPISMDFVLDKQNRMIVFDHPVFLLGSSECIAPADLKLLISFYGRQSTGCYARETFTVTRSTGSGTQTFQHPDLWRARSQTYLNCSISSLSDNITELTTEAEAYRDNYKAHFDAIIRKRQLEYPGLQPIMPTGKVNQVAFHIGKNVVATTMASEGFNHNAFTR